MRYLITKTDQYGAISKSVYQRKADAMDDLFAMLATMEEAGQINPPNDLRLTFKRNDDPEVISLYGPPSPILCAAHADPYILEQAYEQDEEALEERVIQEAKPFITRYDAFCARCGHLIHAGQKAWRLLYGEGWEHFTLADCQRAQAYEQDEEALEEQEAPDLCDRCGNPAAVPWLQDPHGWDALCKDCYDKAINDEPADASLVTGYDNGPTFW